MHSPARSVALALAWAASAAVPLPATSQVTDTVRPLIPLTRLGFQSDTLAFPVTHVDSTLIYYRTVAGLLFDTTATGIQVWTALEGNGAEIIAGTDFGAFIVRIPDPGRAPDDFARALEAMEAEPGVTLAYPKAYWRAFRLNRPDDRRILDRVRDGVAPRREGKHGSPRSFGAANGRKAVTKLESADEQASAETILRATSFWSSRPSSI